MKSLPAYTLILILPLLYLSQVGIMNLIQFLMNLTFHTSFSGNVWLMPVTSWVVTGVMKNYYAFVSSK